MLIFTHGFTSKPRSTAFFAKRPAPITLGLLVLVHEVMAAMLLPPVGQLEVLPGVLYRHGCTRLIPG